MLPQALEGAAHDMYGISCHVDGKHAGVACRSAEYERAATTRLIALFNAHPSVMKVYFNDSKMPGVFPRPRHDDHFHVEVRA